MKLPTIKSFRDIKTNINVYESVRLGLSLGLCCYYTVSSNVLAHAKIAILDRQAVEVVCNQLTDVCFGYGNVDTIYISNDYYLYKLHPFVPNLQYHHNMMQ